MTDIAFVRGIVFMMGVSGMLVHPVLDTQDRFRILSRAEILIP